MSDVDEGRDEQEYDLERSFALIDIEHLLIARGQSVAVCLHDSGHDFHPATFVITAALDLFSGLGYTPEEILAALDEFGREGMFDRVITALGDEPAAGE